MNNSTPAQELILIFDFGSQYGQLIARRVREQHPAARIRLLFTDTLIEDGDLYRFLREGAALIEGAERNTSQAPTINPAAFPPFVYAHHPRAYQVMGGEVVPFQEAEAA